MAATAVERKPWHASFRLLERDERVFAVLLAVVMVGGLAALGLFPLRPRYRDIDLYWLVFCFAAYKVGIFALVTVNPRATRAYFIGALAIDLLLVFVLLCLTGGRRQRLLSPVLSPRRGERLLLRALGRARRGGGGGGTLRLVDGAGAAVGRLDAARDPRGARRAARGDPRSGRRPGAPGARRGRTAERRAHRHAEPAADGPAGAGGGRAHGDGRTSLAPDRPRGAQSDQRHRAERRDARGHRPRADASRRI